MCWDVAAEYPCDALSPGRARRFCAEQISAILGDGGARDTVIEDATIIVSELVTNSVNAGCRVVRVGLTIHRDRLQLCVYDDAPGRPRVERPGPQDVHGRGLAITAALADDWGVERAANGKQVWAELQFPALLTERLDCTV
jgi:anti-sigma regulatory factor (Ser/Thr protein kinase)